MVSYVTGTAAVCDYCGGSGDSCGRDYSKLAKWLVQVTGSAPPVRDPNVVVGKLLSAQQDPTNVSVSEPAKGTAPPAGELV
jgi:hypothetical protein